MAMAQPPVSCQLYHGILQISQFVANPNGQNIPQQIIAQQHSHASQVTNRAQGSQQGVLGKLRKQLWSPFSKIKGTLGKELPVNLEYQMGNNVTINDIDSAVQHLAHRNYPEAFAQDGTPCGKIQICIPDIYLMNKHGANFIQSDKKSVKVDCQQFGNLLDLRGELGNLGGATEVKQKTQVGSDEFVELELPSDQIMSQPGSNKLRDMKTAHGGDLAQCYMSRRQSRYFDIWHLIFPRQFLSPPGQL